MIIQFKFLHYKGCLIQNKRVIKILYMLHSLSSHQCWKINVQILNIKYDYIYELLQSLIDRIKYFYVISWQYYRNITYCITFSIDCPNMLYHDQTQNKFFSLDILFEKNFVVLYTIFLHTIDCSYWKFLSKICVVLSTQHKLDSLIYTEYIHMYIQSEFIQSEDNRLVQLFTSRGS